MAKRITTTEAKANLLALLALVEQSKERFTIVRRGKPIAALVPYSDFEKMDSEEAQSESKQARRMVDKIKSGKEKTAPFSKVASRLEKAK
jgi:prevent-host-death family protein